MAHIFLSDDWLAEVAKLRDELGGDAGPDVKLDVTVTGGPEGDRDVHIVDGALGQGHVDAPTRIVLPYDVARQMFVEGSQQAAMQAFMAGQIKVEGDMSKVMALQGRTVDPALAARVKEVTA